MKRNEPLARQSVLTSRSPTKVSKINPSSITKLQIIFNRLKFHRKRFTFQILKQFHLFPSESASSENFISKYDPLIFDDDVLHTIIKKLQTKLIENKIWGFLNLKSLKYIEQIKQFSGHINLVKKKIQRKNTQISFSNIKTFSNAKKNQAVNREKVVKPATSTIKEEYYRRESSYEKSTIKTQSEIRVNPRTTTVLSPQQVRNRSRSSESKMEYYYEDGKRILLNGQIVPAKIKVLRISPAKQESYTNVRKETSSHFEYQTQRHDSSYLHSQLKTNTQLNPQRRTSPQVIKISPQQRNPSPTYENRIANNGLQRSYLETKNTSVFNDSRTEVAKVTHHYSPTRVIHAPSQAIHTPSQIHTPTQVIHSPAKVIHSYSPTKVIHSYSPSKITYQCDQPTQRVVHCQENHNQSCHLNCCNHCCHHCCHQSHNHCHCSCNCSSNNSQIHYPPKRVTNNLCEQEYLKHLHCFNR